MTDSNMDASDMNPLLYCLATSDKVVATGYTQYSFGTWTGLTDELDDDVMDALEDAAPSATAFFMEHMTNIDNDAQE